LSYQKLPVFQGPLLDNISGPQFNMVVLAFFFGSLYNLIVILIIRVRKLRKQLAWSLVAWHSHITML